MARTSALAGGKGGDGRPWARDEDEFLRAYYNAAVRVSPACLAATLKRGLRAVVNRMHLIGVRNRMNSERW